MSNPPGSPRQISIPDPLWEIFSSMAEESGSSPDSLVSQAMFELAVRLGYVSPIPARIAPPIEEDKLPNMSSRPTRPPNPKFSSGRTRESQSQRKPGSPSSSSIPAVAGPPSGQKRPPRPSPGPIKDGEKGLFIVNEDGSSERIDKDIFIIGRSSKCDLVINSVKVSREHAIITRERGEYFIEDLGSANGTWYKGERIEKMKVRDSDEIFICDEKFKFVLH